MLSRAGQRRYALRRLHHPYERLALSQRYQALPQFQHWSSRIQFASTSTTTTVAPIQPKSQASTRIASLPPTRRFATAASEQHDPHGLYIPFEGEDLSVLSDSSSLTAQWNSQFPFSNSSDPLEHASSVIILNDHVCTRPKPLRRQNGIGGDIEDMLANLDVSLAVGMFDRAALLVRRLSAQYPRGSQEILNLHNKYIQMMVSHMIINRRPSMAFQVQRWFEVDMKMSGVEPDATTYGLLLKMSLRMLHGSKRHRTVHRYWALVKEAQMEEAVLRVPVLSEADLGLLSELCLSQLPASELESAHIHELDAAEKLHESRDASSKSTEMEVLSTEQKGFGLVSLKNTLSRFKQSPQSLLPSDFVGSPEERRAELDRRRQLRLEEDSITSAIDRWRKESEVRSASGVSMGPDKKLGALLYEWHEELSSKIKQELELAALSEGKAKLTAEETDRCEYAPFLRAIGPEKLAGLSILTATSSLAQAGMDKGATISSFVMNLGSAIEEEYLAERFRLSAEAKQDDGPSREKAILKLLEKGMAAPGGKTRFKKLIRKFKANEEPVAWSPILKVKIGSFLASMLFNSTTVSVKQVNPETKEVTISKEPAFRHLHHIERGYHVGYVHLHEKLIQKLLREPPAAFMAKHLPMVAPPRPWEDHNIGGFLGSPTTIVRVKNGDDSQLRYIRAAAERGDLDTIFKGLSVLGKTAWKINKPVFEVMLQAWNSTKAIANIAPLNPDLKVPEKPDTDDPGTLKAYFYEKHRIQNAISGFHSERCFQNFQMEIARTFLNEIFYLPHNMDFRGRAYPLPPYLNQMTADNCRGLLLFSEGKELGERGLRWLKIHLANVYGFDKASFEEREQFAMDHLDDIYDSAENALNGRRWWLQAEDPFQCLAACIELRNALKSPDPTRFVSHLPIHQDGSCNGLQHYAALGGDVIGAQQVNLEPSDRPSDIYTAVAEHVKSSISQDARRGNKLAVVLQNKVTRKVVKQTVMTNVYGVTFIGAVRQVRRQLQDYYPELEKNNIISPCATYISQKIFAALGSMFSGAHAIQFWLGDCANRITRSVSFEQLEALQAKYDKLGGIEIAEKEASGAIKKSLKPSSLFNATVIWTTPLRLPVVQPYRSHKVRRIRTCLQDLSIQDPSLSDVVDQRKQLQAFPPNFIHSLDATHMFLSAIKCDELGLTFSAVHDSFWTHASDVDTMNRVLRDAFIRMHSEDIVQRLSAEFSARYSDRLYLAKVRPDTPLARKIVQFRKQRRIGAAHGKDSEVLLEYKRIKLLSSSDPAEQELGRQMVTPASIFADYPNAEECLSSTQSLGVAGMGHISPEEAEIASQMVNTEIDPGVGLPTLEADPVETAIEASGSEEEVALAAAAEASRQKGKQAKAKKTRQFVTLWLPLTFLPVPPKGKFDVSRLKQSDYFFS
ncbi:hypothetical protein VTO42DRAFT_4578 [Malbranchea cinnamomea]